MARPTRKPDPGGTTSAISESTASVHPDMPPWMLDHVAAMKKELATKPVAIPTAVPHTTEAVVRPMPMPHTIGSTELILRATARGHLPLLVTDPLKAIGTFRAV
jgi:hypothetical protein